MFTTDATCSYFASERFNTGTCCRYRIHHANQIQNKSLQKCKIAQYKDKRMNTTKIKLRRKTVKHLFLRGADGILYSLMNGLYLALCQLRVAPLWSDCIPTHHFIRVDSGQCSARDKFRFCLLEFSGFFFSNIFLFG